MAIRTSAYTIELGQPQTLEVAQGEDRQFNLTFTEDGIAIDLTSVTAIVMTVRARATGLLIFARNYSGLIGLPAAGTPYFQVLQADTRTQTPGPYDVDVTWTDATGYKSQLLVASTLQILDGVGESTDPVTTPPAIPVVYGLNWLPGFWSSPTGGYNVNDSIEAYDGSLGATAISTFRALVQGVTYYPLGPTLVPNTGWAYVGQHGGVQGPAYRTSDTGIAQYTLVKASATAGRVSQFLTTDRVQQVTGVALQSASGADESILVQEFIGITTSIKSDGSAIISAGDLLEPSTTQNGRVKTNNSSNTPVGSAMSGATATLDALVTML